ncbi:hypothetical protein CBS147318_3201 [Penicillium roqueforti]|nr:hypothetical protein CBS147318_3201 [Penicillium roqueforti]
MKIPTSITFATLLAFAQAAPLAPKESRLEARASINDCGSSTFINQSSGGSPLVADCQHLARKLGQSVPAVLDTAHIGNQDIIDVINSSIAKFKWEGKIGAKGTMGCQTVTKSGNTPMTWGIYHA